MSSRSNVNRPDRQRNGAGARQARRPSREPRKDAEGGRPSAWLCTVFIVLAGSAVYLNSFSGVFLLDDNRHIVENTRIQRLMPILPLLESRRPVVTFTLAVNYAIGKLNPWGYHLLNLLVHLAAGLALFGVVRRTLHLDRFSNTTAGSANGLALAVSLIWLVHPLQTQSVTYVIQRGESLMGLFYLTCLYCTIRGASRAGASRGWYVFAAMACALGMASKGVMVTAPVVILLYDRVFLSRSIVTAVRRRWALYLALTATWLILPLLGLAGVFRTDLVGRATVGFSYKGISAGQYALSQPGVILHYLQLCVRPVGQCLDYVWPPVPNLSAAAKPLTVLLLMLAGTAWALVRRPWIGFLAASFFVILSPTSSIIPIKDLAFEHRMYLPSAAVIALLTIGGCWIVSTWLARRGVSRAGAGRIRIGVTALVVVALGFATVRRNRVYHSHEAMWKNVLARNDDHPRAHLGLGRAFERQGRLEEALSEYETAVRLDSKFPEALTNLGLALSKLGREEEGMEHLEQAIRLQPRLVKAYLNLASVHLRNKRLDENKRLEEAIAVYRRGLHEVPGWAEGHKDIGLFLAMREDLDSALEHFNKLIKLSPRSAEAHCLLGMALRQAGRTDEAIAALRTALRFDPDHAEARQELNEILPKQ